MPLREFLRIVASGRRTARNLTIEEAERAFTVVLSGQATDAQLGAFLAAMRWKGETVEELTGFARAARALAKLPSTSPESLVSIGTPHEGHERTPPLEAAGALLAAACGTRSFFVTDRSVPPKGGLTPADAFQGLAGGFTDDVGRAERMLENPGVAALSASAALPGLRRLDRVRAEMEVRSALHTVEKLLAIEGSSVLIGSSPGPFLGVAVDVVRALGHRRGIVLQGPEGSVVPSLVGPTKGIEIDGRSLTPLVVDPADYGFRNSREPSLPESSPAGAASVVRALLTDEAGPARNAALLCAALLQYATGTAASVAEGVDRAAEALDEGKALAVLDSLRAI